MTVSLGGVALDESLALLGYQERVALPHSVHYGLAGGVTIQVAPAYELGANLTLEARQDGGRVYGKYSQAQVEAINALLAAGADVTLVHHLGTWTVRIIGRAFEQVIDYADPGADDWYVGTVSMIITG